MHQEALNASTTSFKSLIETTVNSSIHKAMNHHVGQTEASDMEVGYYDNNEQGVEWQITAYRDSKYVFACLLATMVAKWHPLSSAGSQNIIID
jgi:hypothetical protein